MFILKRREHSTFPFTKLPFVHDASMRLHTQLPTFYLPQCANMLYRLWTAGKSSGDPSIVPHEHTFLTSQSIPMRIVLIRAHRQGNPGPAN